MQEIELAYILPIVYTIDDGYSVPKLPEFFVNTNKVIGLIANEIL
jgi:hypothetical protein